MNKDIKNLLEQLQRAIANPRCIEKEKASRYYCAIKELQQQLEQKNKVINNAKKWVCNYKDSWEPNDEAINELNELSGILNEGSEKE